MPFPYVKCPGPDKVTANLKATVSVQYAVSLLGEGSPYAKVPQTQLKYVELSKDKGNKAKGKKEKEDKAAPGVPVMQLVKGLIRLGKKEGAGSNPIVLIVTAPVASRSVRTNSNRQWCLRVAFGVGWSGLSTSSTSPNNEGLRS